MPESSRSTYYTTMGILSLSSFVTIPISFLKSWVHSWSQFPVTLCLLFRGRSAREGANYIATCRDGIRVGLKLSFLPYRYEDGDEDEGNSSTPPTVSLKSYSQLLCDIHFLLHLICCVFHVTLGAMWFITEGQGLDLDSEGQKQLTWKKIVNFYYPSLALNAIPVVWIYRKRSDELRPLLTCPFQMEMWCLRKGLVGYVNRYLLAVTSFTFATCFFLPIIYFAVSLWRPCLPFVAISVLASDSDCPSWVGAGTSNIPAKIGLGLLDYYFWVFLPGIFLGIGWIALVYPGSAATRRIEVIFRDIKAGNLEAIRGFREVQVMGILTNKFWRFPLMQIVLGEWLIAEVIALYVVIRLHGQIPVEIFIAFCFIAVDGVALIHVHFRLLAEPCLASSKLFEYRKRFRKRGNGWFLRYVRSCGSYRLKMADGRFFDKTTALVVWQFVVDRLVMCLLMK